MPLDTVREGRSEATTHQSGDLPAQQHHSPAGCPGRTSSPARAAAFEGVFPSR